MDIYVTIAVGIVLFATGLGVYKIIQVYRQKHIDIWFRSYVIQRVSQMSRKLRRHTSPIHVIFCMVDHFEPISAGSTREQQRTRMRAWMEGYPALARRHGDSQLRPPQHTWFYPAEDYDAEYLDNLVILCQQGLGEIELHLHHADDTSDGLRTKLRKAISDFSKHGALVTQEYPPRYVYGFIHGNMALDNSRNDPAFCGVNNEFRILKETGCYADFSMPTAPCLSQTRKINAIYYATGHPQRPKSHDTGEEVQLGTKAHGDLLIIAGPLGINWSSRKWGIIPKLENAEIQGSNLPTPQRIRVWTNQHIHVKGRPEWVFVKVSCHGAEDRSRDAVLGEPAHQMYTELERAFRDCPGYCLYYVTAREMYNIVKAAEDGHTGDPAQYRDYLIPPYQTHASEQRGASVSRESLNR